MTWVHLEVVPEKNHLLNRGEISVSKWRNHESALIFMGGFAQWRIQSLPSGLSNTIVAMVIHDWRKLERWMSQLSQLILAAGAMDGYGLFFCQNWIFFIAN